MGNRTVLTLLHSNTSCLLSKRGVKNSVLYVNKSKSAHSMLLLCCRLKTVVLLFMPRGCLLFLEIFLAGEERYC